jgi:tetratricopeptide (TPR) repeat protein
MEGFLAEMKGDDKGRYRSLARALEIFPDDRNLKTVLARYHYGARGAERLVSGRFEEAVEAYRAAVALDGAVPAIRRGAGLAFLGLELPDSALVQFRALARIEPEKADPLLLIGNVLFQLDSLSEASEAYESAIRLDPSALAPQFNLGLLREADGDMEGAEATYREIIRFFPNFAPARLHLAGIMLDRERPGEALALVTSILEKDRSHPEALRLSARALEGLGRDGEAKEVWERLLESVPPDHEAAGEAQERLGRTSR